MTDALTVLEAAGPSVAAAPAEPEVPATVLDAVRRWLTAVGVKQGGWMSPPAGVLCVAFREHAASHGWGVSVGAPEMGRLMTRLGFKPIRRAASGFLVSRESAELLRRYAPAGVRKVKRGVTLLPSQRHLDALRLKPRGNKPRPVRTCDGQVWDSAALLARVMGVSRAAVCRAIDGKYCVSGLHVSYLTKDSRPLQASGTVSVHDDEIAIPSPS